MALLADPSDPLGYDVMIGATDLDPSGRSASGLELVTAAMVHRLTEEKLLLTGSPDDGYVDFGEDVRKWVGEVTDQNKATAKGPLLAIILQRDPRVDPSRLNVAVTVLPSGADYDLQIEINGYTTTGLPLALVLGVDAVAVDLLAQGR